MKLTKSWSALYYHRALAILNNVNDKIPHPAYKSMILVPAPH